MPRKNPESRLQMMLDHTEKLAIEWAVEQVGTIPKAAELLGVSRPYLYKRIDALDLRHLLKNKRNVPQTETHDAPEAPETAETASPEDETETESDPISVPDPPDQAISDSP